jgi:YidC/Oxa1 family membrane protein insertase
MNSSNNRNLIIATVLSVVIFLAWQYFIGSPAEKAAEARRAVAEKPVKHPAGPAGIPTGQSGAPVHISRAQALAAGGARITIDTPDVDGSLLLKGARLDDLRLKCYHERAGTNLKCDNSDPTNPQITLLAPKGTDYPYFVDFGWIHAQGATSQPLPDDSTVWTQIGSGILTPDHPVTLRWDNGHGLVFTRRIAVDNQFMFTVTDSVQNKSGAAATLYPYALVVRDGVPPGQTYWVLHEGFVGVADGTLKDATYSDFKDDGTPPKTFSSTGGWVGITDKYWMAAVIPPQKDSFDGSFRAETFGTTKAYYANYQLGPRTIAAGGTASVTHHLFAGAKVVDTLRAYGHTLGIQRFDLAIDWGWFLIITQPLFWVLDYFYKLLGNFGLAILLLTICVKAVTFPIANASAKTMAKMKKVQPEQEKIKERFADDPAKQQAAVMELYKREKVNPVTGCVPQLLVIPVFFSLYKVFFVTIEMRQAPFYGWIHDLSAPDPTSIINLFGLLPFHPPSFIPAFLSIGIWPILMGITQWVQTKLNPAPADPIQARMFGLMPVMFTFMFATFPAGLVIYYTWNNILGVAQQWYIMRRQGVEVHLFKNLRLDALVQRLTGGKVASDKAANDK